MRDMVEVKYRSMSEERAPSTPDLMNAIVA